MTPRQPHGEHSTWTGPTLRWCREHLGLTRAELGAALGITGTEVYRKERGDRPIMRAQEQAVRWLLHKAGYSDAEIEEMTHE